VLTLALYDDIIRKLFETTQFKTLILCS